MPGMDGLEATKQIVEAAPDTAVLIFTAYSERALLESARDSGARGYLLKESSHDTLLRAIEQLADGEGFFDPALVLDDTETLTPRESEILQLLAERHVQPRRGREALHQPGDREEPRPAHPREARGGHADPRGRDRAARVDDQVPGRAAQPAERLMSETGGDAPVERRQGERRREERERIRLFEQLIAAEQDERRRLAHFLHDDAVQALSGIALMLDAVGHAVEDKRSEDALQILGNALQRQRETIQSLRDLSFNLEPMVLRDRGFGPAVSALADRLELDRDVHVEVDVAAGEELAERARVVFYQLIREALEPGGGPQAEQDQDHGRGHELGRRVPRRRRQRPRRAAARHGRGLRGARTSVERPRRDRARRGLDEDHGRLPRVRRPGLASPACRTSASSGSRAATNCATARATRPRSAR